MKMSFFKNFVKSPKEINAKTQCSVLTANAPCVRREFKILDILKFIAALLILVSHCLPFVKNENINFYFGQWFFRFCVPLFFISSGYFFASFQQKGKLSYIKRISCLFFVSSLLYMPYYAHGGLLKICREFILGYLHLWYLSALTIALAIWFIIEKISFANLFFKKSYPVIGILLLLIGIYYDEYQYVISQHLDIQLLTKIGTYVSFLGGARHALFFALPMLLLGRFLFEHKSTLYFTKTACVLLTGLSFALSFAESTLLRHLIGSGISCDITFFNFLPAVFLFILSLIWQPQVLKSIPTKHLRKTADVIYIIHILVLFVVQQNWPVAYMSRLLLVIAISFILSQIYLLLSSKRG